MKKQYEWVSGGRYVVDPQEIGETIAGLGNPTAEDVVRIARAKGCPLHGMFEWDNAAAAHEHRLSTARLIMRSLVITVKVDGVREPIMIRAFEAVTVEPGEAKAYVPTMRVLSRKDWREEVVRRLRGDLESAKRQLDAYAYLSNEIAKAGQHVDRAIGVLRAAA